MIERNNEDVKYTVDVAGARGGFFTLTDAKKDAMRLARLNPDDSVFIEDSGGMPRYSFYVDDGKMMMTSIKYSTVEVDNES